MQKMIGTIILAFLPFTALADGDATCTTTHECAQKMLASLAELHKTDEALAKQLEALAKKVVELSNTSSTGDSNTLTAAKTHTNDRFTALGEGADTVPKWGNGTSEVCPAGKYMVGAKVNIASGRNAGALYSNIAPICRAFK